jgi:sulfate adenylyltransferase subunit 2
LEQDAILSDRILLYDGPPMSLTHLQRLEAEAIHILREGVAETERPVMLYSAGKDSSVLLHLAKRAFFPATPPFPLLHVDTGWKFRDMYALRDRAAAQAGMELIVHRNPEAEARGINPIDHGSALHTQAWKTDGLRQALDLHGFDAAFGGARRDEERVRAKERIFSFRSAGHCWDPKRQRPELWNLYNVRKAKGESLRIFPLSNWTERDVWTYVAAERIEVAPLYFAAPRPTIVRDGTILMVDDARLKLRPNERIEERWVRFRTLGCWPLSGAVESRAGDVPALIEEIGRDRKSERQGRLIDRDGAASMERKKREGYF